MSADEGAAWAAAVQPVSSLLQLQPQLDSGKLALYDLVLHFWIRMFGDSLSAMRGLSAAIGAISILLIFGLVREIYRCFAEGQPTRGEIAGGFVALMFATNVAMVDTARTARMYPLTIAAELAQILYFIRAQRYGRISNYIGSAIFLALAVAANFTATFVLAGESLWLAYLLIARLWRRSQTDLQITRPAMSLFAGCVLLLPFARGAIAASCNAISGGVLNWIRFQPPLSWSLNVLRGGVGNKSLFLLECALAGFALWRHRRNAPLVPIFIIFMLLGPFVAVMIISLLGRAMMVDRYVLFALVAFLALAASGAEAFASWPARGLVLFLIILLSVRALRHSSGFWVDWREATAIACANSPRNAEI
ncbi:MAG TPA: glycosyltransferase family 39 protein, partial [Candidatus Binataceae bacterium]|nr:glycosyltransferase family 39 protein [Candidatus Binataceae bacterium]